MESREHPIVDLIWQTMTHGKRGRRAITLSADGIRAIEAEVRRSITSGEIVECCEAALTMIGFLSANDDAKEAVVELKRLRRALEPEIEAALRSMKEDVLREAASTRARARHLGLAGTENRAEMVGAPAPAGSIKNRELRPIPTIIR